MRILVSCVVVLLAAASFHPAHGQLRPEVEQFRDRLTSLEGESGVPPRLSPSLGVTLVSIPSGVYVYGSRHATGSETTEATGGNIAAGAGAYIGGGIVGWAVFNTFAPRDTSESGVSTAGRLIRFSGAHLFGSLATGLTVYHGRGANASAAKTIGGAFVLPIIISGTGIALGALLSSEGAEDTSVNVIEPTVFLGVLLTPLWASQGANYMYTNSQ